MIGDLTSHLWQSTLFAGAAALLTLGFRRNQAKIRFWLWFSASLKFFVPFSLLMSLGSQVELAPATRGIAAQMVAPAMALTVLPIKPVERPRKVRNEPGNPEWPGVGNGFRPLCTSRRR